MKLTAAPGPSLRRRGRGAVERAAFGALLAVALCAGAVGRAHAAQYTFPGNLPAGCSGSDGQYSCGALTLADGDVIVIGAPRPATITINGTLTTGGAHINAGGAAADLTLAVSGALSVATGAVLVGAISAASLADGAGGATYNGSISTTGAISLSGDSKVTGDVASSGGAITVGTPSAAGAAPAPVVSGNVTANSGAITIGYNSWVGGAVVSQTGAITLGYQGKVGGAITTTTGAISVGYGAAVDGPITSSSGAIGVGYSAAVRGAITGGSGAITIGYSSVVSAWVNSTGSAAVTLGAGASVAGVCCGAGVCTSSCVTNNSGQPMPPTSPAAAGLDHLELRHTSGNLLTCTPSTLTVAACQDAACTRPFTEGASGIVSAAGSGMTVNWPNGAGFNIKPGDAVTSVPIWVTSVGTVSLSATLQSPGASGATRCNFGNPSCAMAAGDSGLVVAVPDHRSEASQSMRVSALRKADGASLCVPAFANVTKSIILGCFYQDPGVGTSAVRVGGRALNSANNPGAACDAGGQAVGLAFDANGTATTTLQYADVGRVRIGARYSGAGADAGLSMTGSASFVAAPAAFAVGAVSAGPIPAGSAFVATVTALNSSGATTPNFGQEATPATVSIGFVRAQPNGPGASDGVFTGSAGPFAGGAASASDLVWSEVGRGDLSVALAGGSYLGTGLSASGTTGSAGAVGRFVPHHFDVAVTPACGSFTYAGQPFGVGVTAMNGLPLPGPTVNYDGSVATTPNFARAVTLRDAPVLGLGSFGTTNALAASAFVAGLATTSTVYAFSAKLTAPQQLVIRAVDADAVGSAGHAEGFTVLRSGRLRLSNAFGSEKAALQVGVQAQYWSANSWLMNAADSCSAVPAAAVALSTSLDNRGAPTTAWSTRAGAVSISGGSATLLLTPPAPTATGSVDLALNLGSTGPDQSCLATHPYSVGAALPWLRSQQGSCAVTWDRDPAARASFGIYAPETRKILHVRDIY